MQSSRSISFVFFLLTSICSNAQNIGIGTNSPAAAFNVNAGKTVLFGADSTTASGKLIYYGTKGALRSGYITNAAAGDFSSAFGYANTVAGYSGFAAGNENNVSGPSAVALGASNVSISNFSTAIGWQNTASGIASMAFGTLASSTGVYSIAIGTELAASGEMSTAIGRKVSSNGKKGAFIIGDSDPNLQGITYSGSPDQFVARFANGYYLMTSGDQNRTGVQIAGGGNAWLSISDKYRKENFEILNDESILKKLSAISYSSWNYKGQDAATFRHYGIMAQDFYNAFGKDSYGSIGCDTLVNPVDMMGIAYSAIKALEIRTQKLDALEKQLCTLQATVARLEELLLMKEGLKMGDKD